MIATSRDRVTANTCEDVNAQIRLNTEESIRRCGNDSHAIEARLSELDEEWDIERYLETAAPAFSLIGLTLGLTVSKKFLAIPILVQAFFLQHAIQGWCPPLPVLRRMGVRTAEEIDEERYALKALRGDFSGIKQQQDRSGAAASAAFMR